MQKSNVTSFLRVALKKTRKKTRKKKVKKFAFDHCKTGSERYMNTHKSTRYYIYEFHRTRRSAC